MVWSSCVLLVLLRSVLQVGGNTPLEDFPKPPTRPSLSLVYIPPETDISRDRRDNSFVDDFSIDLVETIRVGGDDSQVQEEMGESKMATGFVEEKAMSRLDVDENELLPVLVAPEERNPASADPSNTYLQVGNWIAQWDAQYSAWYYYNTETRISTWDKPDDLKGLDFKDPLPDQDPILDEIFSDNSIREERDKGTSHFPPLNGASTNHHHAHSAAANQHSHSAHAHETPNAATSSVDTYGSPQAGAIDEYGSPQAAPVSNYSPPSYNVPSYNAPSYNAPSYNAPSYNAPSYNAPSYNPPSYNAPSYNCKGQDCKSSSGFLETITNNLLIVTLVIIGGFLLGLSLLGLIVYGSGRELQSHSWIKDLFNNGGFDVKDDAAEYLLEHTGLEAIRSIEQLIKNIDGAEYSTEETRYK